MTIDVRARQVGALFSMGIEEDPPAPARARAALDLPRRLWVHLNAALVLRERRAAVPIAGPRNAGNIRVR